jgi:hypothetical protein
MQHQLATRPRLNQPAELVAVPRTGVEPGQDQQLGRHALQLAIECRRMISAMIRYYVDRYLEFNVVWGRARQRVGRRREAASRRSPSLTPSPERRYVPINAAMTSGRCSAILFEGAL